MIKAVAIDIDGTLTDKRRRFDLGAVEKVREVEALGVPVILATGNILCVAETACIFIGTSGPIIAENGGVIASVKTSEVHYVGDIKKVERAYAALSKKYKLRKVLRSEMRKTEIAIYRDVGVKDIKNALKGFDVNVVDTKFAIHLKDPKVSKGRALKEVAKMLGIKPEEMAAIGDSENDREMLEYAGYSISVGEKSLSDVSDYTTKATFGEGGREALKHLINKITL